METFGLTPLQQGMYYHHLLEPDSGVHLEQIVVDLPGDIDSAASSRRGTW